ncbi:chemotaxis protein CheX [Roseospira visakhapatnamensis]|uniref:CheY-specific phosphatase CheX n=1 Tax=Roseospira visakhapatnamensis TaxID=390880 RepID=A0A7W6WA26_9PROT|nr:chemotaxis protein CheX [Roseospira visakhapatnamensis]MBB4266765.1 CheY-specific phosphatase CheX [Roseospira visakhapatnamensis]
MYGRKAPGFSSEGGFGDALIQHLFDSILSRTRQVLSEEAGITVRDGTVASRAADIRRPHAVTVLATLGAPVSALVAFSFEEPLLESLVEGMTGPLIMDGDDVGPYREDCAAEAVNMALGLGTADLPSGGMAISLSPPVVLDNTQWAHRNRDAFIATMRVITDKGVLDVSVADARDPLDAPINSKV